MRPPVPTRLVVASLLLGLALVAVACEPETLLTPNTAPQVTIVAPGDTTVTEGADLTFEGTATDAEDGNLSGEMEWSSDQVTDPIGTGASVTTSALPVGVHTITASVADSEGATGTASVTVTVNANAAPTVTIEQPMDGATVVQDAVTFSGTASDAEDGDLSAAIQWSSDVDGDLGTGDTVTVSLTTGDHIIAALVTDDHGASTADTIQITAAVNNVPAVAITAPADSSTFDSGDDIVFTGSVSDPEEGALPDTAVVWTSDLDGPFGTGDSLSTADLTVGRHTITLTATDSYGAEASDSIDLVVVQAFITVPETLNVGFTKQASIPVQLSEPAPAGGVTIELVSSDTSIVGVVTSSVFIDEGQLAENGILEGVAPGSTTVTAAATAPDYVPDESAVDVTASLNITASSITIDESFPGEITIELRSSGTLIAAPTGGLSVDLTPGDPTCATAPSPVTIPEGVTSTTATVSYGGSAALPCGTWLTASATDIDPDSVDVRVEPVPAINAGANRTVGSGLQRNSGGSLETGNHGGVTVTIVSSDPAVALVSPDDSTPGTDTVRVDVADNNQGFGYYVQGVEGVTTDTTATIHVSAPGFAGDSATVTVVQAGFQVIELNGSPNSLADNDPFRVAVGLPRADGVSVYAYQNVRAGGDTLTFDLGNSDPAVGQLVTSTDTAQTVSVQIVPGQYRSPGLVDNGGVAFDPLGAGSTDVSGATTAGLITTDAAIRTVTVSDG